MGYIYLITNTITKKRYIGQTLENDINKRWNQHKKMCKNSLGRLILSAYKKYGIENFKFQIICICFDDDCNRFEEEYIKKLNTLAPNGYNLKAGGNNSKHHPDTLKLMSQRLKGKIWTQMTPEIKKKISEGNKGEKNGNYGKKMSEDQKKKISDSARKNHKDGKYNERNNNLTEKALTALNKGRKEKGKKVGKYDNEDNLLEIYNTISDAARKNNTSHQQIGKVCNKQGYYKTAGGFIWKFIND